MGLEPEREFDRIARLATRFLRVPSAFITFFDKDRQIFKGEFGVPESWASLRQSPITNSFCRHMIADGKPLIVSDARLDARLADNPAIGELGLIAYAGFAINLPTGEPIGSLCAIDYRPKEWSDEDICVLTELAELVSREIALRLEMARREAAEAEILLVARELQHRARNAFSIVQAVISLSMRDKALLPLKLEIIDRISAVSTTQDLIAEQPSGVVWFSDVVDRELSPLAKAESYKASGSDVAIVAYEAVFVGMIVHELTTNAIKYGALRPESKGLLSLDWSSEIKEGVQILQLDWQETNLDGSLGSHLDGDDESGFGSELLHILVTNQLKGRIERDLSENGLAIHMQLRLALPPKLPQAPVKRAAADV